MSRNTIHRADFDLKNAWLARVQALPPSAHHALRLALIDLRRDAQHRAELQWRRHKGPMGCYWRAVAVYAGHIARCLR